MLRAVAVPDWIRHPSRIFYGWWLVGISLLVMGAVVSPLFQGAGVFFVALEDEFGWKRATLAGAFALARAEGAFLGPIEGYLTDRLGTRRMVLFGMLALGLGFFAFSFVHNLLGFYAAMIFMMASSGFGGFIPLMTAINNWFEKKRTLAVAIAQAGFNVGGLFVPVLAWAVLSWGWRSTAVGMGAGIVILGLVLPALIRNRPQEYGQRPYGAEPRGASNTSVANERTSGLQAEDFTIKEAIRTSSFWTITIAHGCAGIVVQSITIHLIPSLKDNGLSLEMAGLVVTVFTGVAVVAQLLAGFFGDRLPKPPVITALIAVQATGLIALVAMPTLTGAFVFAVLFGIGFGGRVPLLIAIRGEYFGRRNFATILGFSQTPQNLVGMVAPVGLGYLFDVQGNYTTGFLLLIAINVTGVVAAATIHRPSRRAPVVVANSA